MIVKIKWRYLLIRDTLFWFRIIGIPILAICYALFQMLLLGDELDIQKNIEIFNTSFLRSFLIIFFTWNGCELISRTLDDHHPWIGHWGRRLFIQTIAIGVYSVSVIIIFLAYFDWQCGWGMPSKEYLTNGAITLLTSIMVNAIAAGVSFYQYWKRSHTQNEALQKALLESELETLKSQVNPHFLFNSLNTLTGLISDQPKKAEEFVIRLAEVYRYILQNRGKNVVLLQDEILVLESYLFLNQTRFGEALQYEIIYRNNYSGQKILNLGLQILVENCIRHNVISMQSPLWIKIVVDEHQILVENNLNPKTGTQGTGAGLENLGHRCRLENLPEPQIISDEKSFKVFLPLI